MKATKSEPTYTLEMTEKEAILLMALLGDMNHHEWKKHLESYNYGDMFKDVTYNDTCMFYDTLYKSGLVVPGRLID